VNVVEAIEVTGEPMQFQVRKTIWVCVLLAMWALIGCAGRAPSIPPPDPNPMDREIYRIGVTDVLQISVWKNPELEVVIPVRPDGKISFPLLDDIQAEGLMVMELKAILTRELAEYITAPDVTVIVREMNSQFVSIMGAVPNSTRIPLTRDLRVLEAIAQAGGFAIFSDKKNIRIVRRGPGGEEVEFRFDYNAYIKGKAPGTNIVLQHGDMVIVPE
jgi:polysaccharide export outer membrane protein